MRIIPSWQWLLLWSFVVIMRSQIQIRKIFGIRHVQPFYPFNSLIWCAPFSVRWYNIRPVLPEKCEPTIIQNNSVLRSNILFNWTWSKNKSVHWERCERAINQSRPQLSALAFKSEVKYLKINSSWIQIILFFL